MDLTATEPEPTVLTRTHANSGLPKEPQLQSQEGTQHAALLPGAHSRNMLMGQAQLHPVSEHCQGNRPDAMADAEEGVAEPTAAEDCHAEHQGTVVPRQGVTGRSVSQGILPIGKSSACHPERPLVVTTNPDCLIRRRRSLYEALLHLERQNAAVIERDLPYVDLVLSPSACLCIWTEEQLLQGTGFASDSNNSNLAMLLQHRTVGPQLQRLSFAYSSCLLCIEGSRAFEQQLAEHLSKLYAMARHAGLSLQYFFSSSPAMTQELISKVASTFLAELQALSSDVLAPLALEENPSASEVMLTSFPSMNPMSAARIILLGCSLSKLLSLSAEEQKQLADKLPDIPSTSLDLFFQQANWGQAITGLLPAAPGPEQHQVTLHRGQQATALPFDQNVSIDHLPRTYRPSHTQSAQMPTALNVSLPADFAHQEAALAPADTTAAAAAVVMAPPRRVSWDFVAETDPPQQAASGANMHAQPSNQHQYPGQIPGQKPFQGAGQAVRPTPAGHGYSGRSRQTGNPFSAFQYQPQTQAHSSSHDDAQLHHQHHHQQQHPHHFVQNHRQPGYLSDMPFEIQDVSDGDGMDLFEGQTLDQTSGASEACFGRTYPVHHQQQQQQRQSVDWHSYLPEQEPEAGADADAPIFWNDGEHGHMLQQPVCMNGHAVMDYPDAADGGMHAMIDGECHSPQLV
ncbi:TPA: hypothetical protein ACH3X2_003639 [Trebouxia sp. C0005]